MSEALNARGLNRRKFLKMTAIAGVAGATSALGADESKVLRPANAQELKEKYKMTAADIGPMPGTDI